MSCLLQYGEVWTETKRVKGGTPHHNTPYQKYSGHLTSFLACLQASFLPSLLLSFLPSFSFFSADTLFTVSPCLFCGEDNATTLESRAEKNRGCCWPGKTAFCDIYTSVLTLIAPAKNIPESRWRKKCHAIAPALPAQISPQRSGAIDRVLVGPLPPAGLPLV